MKVLRNYQHFAIVLFCFITPIFLGGCNPEKAEALLSAAQAFKNEAKKAISAYEELLLAGLDSPELSEKEAMADIIRRGNSFANQGKEITFNGVTRGLQDPFKSAKAEVKALVQRQNLLYDAFADSLINLPRGSYFAAEQVQCVEEIARRLVINIANYRIAIETRPVELVVPEEDAVYDLENALSEGTELEKNDAARKIYYLYNQKQELNNRIIAQATIAAETGLKVIKAAHNYDKLSVEELLKLVQQALAIAGTLEGLDTTKALSSLDKALTKAKGDAHWQEILKMEVYSAGTKCNPIM
ncbi:hypothetical protein ACFL0O_03320 [Thermodesulfobacteriota bacterium]